MIQRVVLILQTQSQNCPSRYEVSAGVSRDAPSIRCRGSTGHESGGPPASIRRPALVVVRTGTRRGPCANCCTGRVRAGAGHHRRRPARLGRVNQLQRQRQAPGRRFQQRRRQSASRSKGLPFAFLPAPLSTISAPLVCPSPRLPPGRVAHAQGHAAFFIPATDP